MNATLINEFSVHRYGKAWKESDCAPDSLVCLATAFTISSLCADASVYLHFSCSDLAAFVNSQVFFGQLCVQPNVSPEITLPRWIKAFTILSLAIKV